MVEDFSYICCRVCGGEIPLDAQTCPLCSSRQQIETRIWSSLMIIALALVGFVGIVFLGILSARAIPEFACFRSNTCNAIALKNIRGAKSGLENYFSRNGRYPDTLGQIMFTPEEGVTVTLSKVSDRNYLLLGRHERGDREYLAVSGKDGIFSREKNQPGLQFVAVK
jgi:predicted nucleic acid-binding Zn ribbon protein